MNQSGKPFYYEPNPYTVPNAAVYLIPPQIEVMLRERQQQLQVYFTQRIRDLKASPRPISTPDDFEHQFEYKMVLEVRIAEEYSNYRRAYQIAMEEVLPGTEGYLWSSDDGVYVDAIVIGTTKYGLTAQTRKGLKYEVRYDEVHAIDDKLIVDTANEFDAVHMEYRFVGQELLHKIQ